MVSSRVGEIPRYPLLLGGSHHSSVSWETPRWHHPYLEFVADAEVSPVVDPYLNDHRVDGECWFPGVVGLEAMAQGATVLLGEPPRGMENVRFLERLVVPEAGTTIRVAALRTSRSIRVALRSAATQFAVDHFTAEFPIDGTKTASGEVSALRITSLEAPQGPVRIDAGDLYGTILFQRGLFQRLHGYSDLFARTCAAELTPPTVGGVVVSGRGTAGATQRDARDTSGDDPHGIVRWFHGYHSQRLLLGDAGARDAVLHAIQACVPDGTLLPLGVEHWQRQQRTTAPHRMVAREVEQRGDEYFYDIAVFDEDDHLLEEWRRAHFTRVRGFRGGGAWPPFLVGPFLERWWQEDTPAQRGRTRHALSESTPDSSVRVVVENHTPNRELRRERSLERLIDPHLRDDLRSRSDGKPWLPSASLSLSHDDPLTLAVVGDRHRGVACDVEHVVVHSSQEWQRLLGDERWNLVKLLAARWGEQSSAHTRVSESVAATMVWCALECAKKGGLPVTTVPTLIEVRSDRFRLHLGRGVVAGWVGELLPHDPAQKAAEDASKLWVAAVLAAEPERVAEETNDQ